MSLATTAASFFIDTSTECAICLGPFDDNTDDDEDDDEDDEDDTKKKKKKKKKEENAEKKNSAIIIKKKKKKKKKNTITLTTCGHRYHLACIREQIQHTKPNYSKRLLFTGCRCCQCGIYCDHPLLQDMTRTTDRLRNKVDTLIIEQMKIDGISISSSSASSTETTTTNNSNNNNSSRIVSSIEDARRLYAFYLCSQCNEPYFGGTVECADQYDDGELTNSEDRVCSSCSPPPMIAAAAAVRVPPPEQQEQEGTITTTSSRTTCHDPSGHGGYHIYKCRYCCQPSKYVCYGNVHFCQSCHDRNTERVQSQQQQQSQRSRRRDGGGGGNNKPPPPPPLEPIPCPGETCTYPKPISISNDANRHHHHHHRNGPSRSCEQVYYCAWCLSNEQQQRRALQQQQEPVGSRNFVINPSGERGLYGWTTYGRHHSNTWQVEQSDIPVNANTTTNFVSSFQWCRMHQRIPIHQYVRRNNNGSSATTNATSSLLLLRIEVSCMILGRTDCPSVFRLGAVLLDNHSRIIQQKETRILHTPADVWERVSLMFETTNNNVNANTTNNVIDDDDDAVVVVPSTPPLPHEVVIIIMGKDSRFWQGLYGAKVANCSVRILGTNSNELNNILISHQNVEEQEHQEQGRLLLHDDDDRDLGQQQQQQHDDDDAVNNIRNGRRHRIRPINILLWQQQHFWDVAVPIISVIIFIYWLGL